MNKFLLLGAAILFPGPLLLAAPAPAATPRPRPPFLSDDQLLGSGSFELPRVHGRTPREAGADFPRFGQGEWSRFEARPHGSPVVAGLTDEIARAGRQALYVEFNHVKAPNVFYELAGSLIAVKPNEKYHVSIWGRIDAKRPLTIDQRIPVLQLTIDFFQADGQTQTGDSILKVQPIPGSPNRPLFFTADRWTEYFADADSPEDAAFIRVTWAWGTAPSPGETDGVVYFDDTGISGAKVEPKPEPDEPEAPKPEAAKPEATPAAKPAPTAAPRAPAKKAR